MMSLEKAVQAVKLWNIIERKEKKRIPRNVMVKFGSLHQNYQNVVFLVNYKRPANFMSTLFKCELIYLNFFVVSLPFADDIYDTSLVDIIDSLE